MQKAKSSLLSSSIYCVRQMVLRVGFKFKLTMARVRTPAPSRLLMALLAGYGVHAMALPTGGQVTSGNVILGTPANGSLDVTQTTRKGIIDWQTFNVASGEKVNFLQPGATSSTLNRVIGSDPTSIFGQINATGQVFLINNAGIYFAPGSQVNAAGLVASTLHLADTDYLSGNFVFSGTGGAVDNQGVLRAGFVALAGAQVFNTGTIVADGGTAALLAGSRITLNLTGSDLVSVSVDAPTAAALVHSGGIVQADGGQVLISAKATNALLGTVVNVDGIVQAHSIGSRNGVITLDGGTSGVVEVTGTLDASGKGAGQTGGTVKVLGANAGLFGATVDVSGDAGGGVVRVGGDWHGAGADGDANASQAIVDDTSVINANAITRGNGGNVVVWSDDHTQFSGTVTARGGSAGGNGGLLETSSHDMLQASSTVNLGADAGKGGMWLIDPRDLTISGGTQSGITASGGNTFTANNGTSLLNTGTLATALQDGVTVNVNTGTTGAAAGNITVAAAITAPGLGATATATLNLNAQGSIIFAGGSIAAGTAGSALNVNLNAGTTGSGAAGAGSNTSSITMDAASVIATGTGNLGATAKGAITLATLAVGGTTALVSASGNGAIGQTAVTVGNPTVAWTLGDTFTATAGTGNIMLTNGGNSIGKLAIVSAGAVDVSTGAGIALGAITAATLHLSVDGNVTQTGVVHTTTSTSIDDTATGGTIALDTKNNNFTGFAATTTGAAGKVSVTNAHDLVLGTIVTHDLTIDTSGGSAGVVSQAASTHLTVPGAVSVTANGTDNVTVGSAASSIGSFGALGAVVSVTVGAAPTDSLALDAIQATTLSTTTGSAGSVTQNGTTSAIHAATTNFGAGSGGVTIGNTGNAIVTWGATAATGNVTFTSAGAIALGGVSAASLDVNATGTGAVTQTSGVLDISGAANIQAGNNNDITLASANSFGSFGAHGDQVVVTVGKTAGSSLLLDTVAASSLTTSTGTAGSVSQNGAGSAVTVTTTAFGSGTGGVNIGNAGNAISTWGSNTTGTTTFNSSSAIVLGANAANVLSVTAGGGITQAAGILTIATTSALNAGGNNITLNSANDFQGAVTATGNSVSLTDANALAVHLSAAADATLAAGGVLTVDGSTGTTLSATGHGIVFGTTGNTTTVGTALTLNDNVGTNAVTQGAALTVGTTTSITAGTNAVTLNDAGNDFTGSVTATSAGALTLKDANALTAVLTSVDNGTLTAGSGALTVSGATAGNLTVGGASVILGATTVGDTLQATTTGNGTLTQTGALIVTNGSTLNAGTGDITLTTAGSNFHGLVTATGGNVQLGDTDALSVHLASATRSTLTAGGVLTVDGTTSGDLNANGVGIVFGGGATQVGGQLDAEAGAGSITQAGQLKVLATTGTTVLNAGTAHAVSLTDTTNVFAGHVDVTGSSIDLRDAGNLDVTAHVTNGGNLTLAATAGTLSVSTGPITTTGDVSFTSGTGLTISDTINAHNVALGGGAISIGSGITASGTFTATSSSTISETGAGVVDAHLGASTVNAGGHAVTLDAGNDFGTLAVTGGAVSINDVNALTVHVNAASASLTAGAGTVLTMDGSSAGALVLAGGGIVFGSSAFNATTAGTLSANSGAGSITQIGTLAVTGTSSLTSSASAITLSNAGNDFAGIVTVSGGAVTLNDANALSVHLNNASSASLTAGTLLTVDGSMSGTLVATGGGVSFGTTNVTALTANAGTGGIFQTGALTVSSATSATATGGVVTLDNINNDFGAAVTASGTTITLVDSGALTAHVTATDATVTALGGGALSVDGTASHNLTVSGAGIDFGVTNVTNALSATSAGAITQSGALGVGGTSGLNAGLNAITLTTGTNDFGGLVTATGGVVQLADTNAMAVALNSATTAMLNASGVLTVSGGTSGDLHATGNGVVFGAGTTSVGGTLTASSGTGTITQSGSSAIHSATTTLDAGTHAITLSNATNDFGTVSVTGGALSLGDANAMTVHLVSVDSATLVAGATLDVDGGTTNGLFLTGNGVVLGATTVGGALAATATGAGTITQTSAIQVGGTSTLDAGSHAVTLANAGNVFSDVVTVTGGVVNLASSTLLIANLLNAGSATLNANGTLFLGGSSTGAVSGTGNGIAFLASGTNFGGPVDVHSGGAAITQAGSVAVTGTTLLDAGSGNVTLTGIGNNFGGLVTVNGGTVGIADGGAMSVHLGSVNNASLAATGALAVDGGTATGLTASGNGVSFGTTSVGGALVANTTGTGTIAQTGVLSVAGATTLNAGTHAITLADVANDFGGAVTATGGAVSLADANALTTHLSGVGSATLASAGVLTLDGNSSGAVTGTGDGIVFGSGATTVVGALTAHSGAGTITQTGSLAVTGASTLDAGTSAITLTASGDHFGGLVTATGGTLAITDDASLAVHLAGVTNATLVAANNVSVDGTTVAGLTANGASVTFGAAGTTVGGTLLATASTGAITQAGVLVATNASTLTATAGSITLGNPNNDFGSVTASAAGTLSLADVGALTAHVASATDATLVAGGVLTADGGTSGALQATGNGVVFGPGGTTVGGALAAHSGSGTITQAGSLSVTGASTLDAGTHAITLATATNDFGGAVTLDGGTVSLADANTLTAHLASTGDTTLTAAGLLGVDGTSTAGLTVSGAGVVFGTGTTHVTGALVANSGTGSITQSGALVVGGASTLDAGTNAITLTNIGNQFGGALATTGGAVSLTVANDLSIHLINATSETLNAGGVLTLDGSTNGNVVANGNGVVFGATSISGTLSSNGGTGGITQTGAVAVTGATTLGSGTGAITLTNAGNDFTGAVTATGGAVSLTDTNALTAHVTAASAALVAGGQLNVDGSTTGALGVTGAGIGFGATTVHGALTATGFGAVTQTGDLAVTGATTLSAAGQSVTLTRQTNALAGGVTVAAGAADIEQAGALTAHLNNAGSVTVASGAALAVDGTSTGNVVAKGATVRFGSGSTAIGGTLTASASAGDITQTGTLAVTGSSTLTAGTGNVTLATASNVMAGVVTAAGASITLTDASALTAHVSANGSATLTSAGALTVDGSANALTLTGAAVSFGGAGTTVAGALNVTGTSVGQSGALAVTGLSSFNAGSGDILLDSPGTNLQGAITATGHTIQLTNAHAIDATLTASGDVVLSSTADVSAVGTFHGGLKVTGADVTFDQGTSAQATVVGGLLDVTSTGDTSLGYVHAGGATVTAGGSVMLGGTLTSAGNVTLKGRQIQGVNAHGGLDVAAGFTAALDTSGSGGGNIGKGSATTAGLVDDQAIIVLLGSTGQSGLFVDFNAGQSAWFRVASQVQTHQINPHQLDSLRSQTFFCDTQTCVNVLGQTTAIADTVVSNILSAAAQDAADAAFGTENLDFAIRKGYVTTIGRVPPGIDEIAGDLGATPCDSRVTSSTGIAADKACSAGAKAAK